MNNIRTFTLLTSLLMCSGSHASDSWYVVKNYRGTLGKYPVHVSLQTYQFGAYVSVKGSYYYDKYHAPIALYGRETADGLVLCEVASKTDFEKYLLFGERYSLSDCPFRLVNNEQGLTGVWQNEKSTLAVSLSSTASMDQTHIIANQGSIEIPFWGQTATHSFMGVYENSGDGLSVNHIKVLDKKQGNVIQVINPQTENCQFGFYMTAIYQNIETINDSTVSFNCYSTKADISDEYIFNKKEGLYYPAQ